MAIFPSRPRIVDFIAWALLAVALLFAVYVRVRLREFPLERDEGEFAYAGQLILQGVPPYKLAYNMKLPGTYLAYAALMAVFGQTTAGIHLGLLAVNLATIVLLYRFGGSFSIRFRPAWRPWPTRSCRSVRPCWAWRPTPRTSSPSSAWRGPICSGGTCNRAAGVAGPGQRSLAGNRLPDEAARRVPDGFWRRSFGGLCGRRVGGFVSPGQLLLRDKCCA